ncbi:MAG TPA: hypothetical protein VHV83_13265 [Armatimonadota bacterium]|nr:hypothetical protein [Armatimonadota bacterium]
MTGMLFWGELLVATLMIAFLAGLVAGAIKGEDTDEQMMYLGAYTGGFFAVAIALPLCVSASGRLFPQPLHGFTGVLLGVFAIILVLVFLGPFAIVGSLPGMATAACGAFASRWLLKQSERIYSITTALVVLLIVGIILVQGGIVRQTLRSFNPALEEIKAAVNSSIIDSTHGWTWRVELDRKMRPEVRGIVCDSRNGVISIQMSSQKQFRSAHVTIWTPRIKRLNLDDKEAVVKYLSDCGVRGNLLSLLKKDKYNQWTAEKGNFSLLLSNYRD